MKPFSVAAILAIMAISANAVENFGLVHVDFAQRLPVDEAPTDQKPDNGVCFQERKFFFPSICIICSLLKSFNLDIFQAACCWPNFRIILFTSQKQEKSQREQNVTIWY